MESQVVLRETTGKEAINSQVIIETIENYYYRDK